jgi:phosphatidylserine/phosphatidylglycerophosphate/cardiolipin synthase-like enzyme
LKLLIEPDDGVAPILSAIKSAKKGIEIMIFRFDRREIEAALKAAVDRGVNVHALIAFANRGGEENLRALEMRFLKAGITVARTADDLLRYHDKILIVDRKVLYLFSFNYTHLDIDHSRGFGIVTRNRKPVQEALKLFEADTKRRTYTPGLDTFIVSPFNARKQLSAFIKKARKELMIYDPKISDPDMIRLLQDRADAGVNIRIIGRLGKKSAGLKAQKLTRLRLHTRTIIRDNDQAFVGSQSLRKAELDLRREVGMIVRDPKVIRGLIATFESDWASNETGQVKETSSMPEKEIRQTVKVITKELPPLASTVKKAVKRVVAKAGQEAFADAKVKATVKKVVKRAVKEAVKEVAAEAKPRIKRTEE